MASKETIQLFGHEYTSGSGKKLIFLWNNAGIRAAERLGLNQPGIGDRTNDCLLVYGALLACQPKITTEDIDDLFDIETYHSRRAELMKAVVEARKKADPAYRKQVEELEAKAAKEGEAEPANPPQASE